MSSFRLPLISFKPNPFSRSHQAMPSHNQARKAAGPTPATRRSSGVKKPPTAQIPARVRLVQRDKDLTRADKLDLIARVRARPELFDASSEGWKGLTAGRQRAKCWAELAKEMSTAECVYTGMSKSVYKFYIQSPIDLNSSLFQVRPYLPLGTS